MNLIINDLELFDQKGLLWKNRK